jgi:hypothetical protein
MCAVAGFIIIKSHKKLTEKLKEGFLLLVRL